MSLEQKIDELTSTVAKLITVTQALHDLRADAIEKVTAAATAPAGKAPKDKKAEETKADTAKANISDNPENRVDPAAAAKAQLEDATKLAADYIGASDREEERAARKDKIKKLLNHEQIRASGVKDGEGKLDTIGNFDLYKDQVTKLAAKGDITTPPSSSSSDLDL
ncbi:hypothetical protein [Rhizobium wenxiniae]|uniref:hypothetical protein n=1 Tax=Rhizobium wenxiniae TaxID=1737357 RepID=UPI003C2954A7